jgi:hypothetical protein
VLGFFVFKEYWSEEDLLEGECNNVWLWPIIITDAENPAFGAKPIIV